MIYTEVIGGILVAAFLLQPLLHARRLKRIRRAAAARTVAEFDVLVAQWAPLDTRSVLIKAGFDEANVQAVIDRRTPGTTWPKADPGPR